ncbi:MAG: hypothetical protein VKJ06_00400 [Vampirovibrionales bacterium]|nr:hypothetical protein [Vampirovibrionales bacterium]
MQVRFGQNRTPNPQLEPFRAMARQIKADEANRNTAARTAAIAEKRNLRNKTLSKAARTALVFGQAGIVGYLGIPVLKAIAQQPPAQSVTIIASGTVFAYILGKLENKLKKQILPPKS